MCVLWHANVYMYRLNRAVCASLDLISEREARECLCMSTYANVYVYSDIGRSQPLSLPDLYLCREYCLVAAEPPRWPSPVDASAVP